MRTIDFLRTLTNQTADWRARKAKEFPSDGRNRQAVQLLTALAEGLGRLGPPKAEDNYDLESWEGLERNLGLVPDQRVPCFGSKVPDADYENYRESKVELAEELLRGVGFQWIPSPEAFAREFCKRWAKIL
jgi:hypothetical protein